MESGGASRPIFLGPRQKSEQQLFGSAYYAAPLRELRDSRLSFAGIPSRIL